MSREYLVTAVWIGVGMVIGVIASKATDPITAYGAGSVLLFFHLILTMRQDKANHL